MDLFHLQTARDRWLVAGPDGRVAMETGKGANEPAGGGELRIPNGALVLCVPRGGPQIAFLVAPDGRTINVEGDGFAGPAVSARLRRVPGRVELRHPLAPVRFLGVVFDAPGGRPARVMFDRIGHAVLDRFTAHPATADALHSGGRAVLAELARAAVPPMRADSLAAMLHEGELRLTLAEALIRVLPPEELQVLASRAMTRPADAALLARAMPGDPWVTGAMPALLTFCARGRPTTGRAVSPATDEHVSVLQSGALRPQAGLALAALARRTVSPRRVAAVLATARNEGPYLLDWLAHHRAVGFDHAVIYSNDNDDGSDELLGLLADAGEITWVRNVLGPAARAQWKAYGHAFKMLPDLVDYRWTMVLDLDEYFSFRSDVFRSVAEVAGWHEHQPTDAVALRWLNFAADPSDIWHDTPTTRRFIRRDPAVSPIFKSLVRSNLFWDSHCHFPYPTLGQPFSYRLEDGSFCHHMDLLRGEKARIDPISAEHAWIAHYMFRSAGEALVKAARGDATWRADTRQESERLDAIVTRFVGLSNKPGLVTDTRTLACAPDLDAELARLGDIGGVAECNHNIKQRFGERLRAGVREYLAAPEQTGQHEAYSAFRAILLGHGRTTEPAKTESADTMARIA